MQEDSFSFWKNLVLAIVFFVVTPITLVVSLFSLTSLANTQSSQKDLVEAPVVVNGPTSGVRVFASLPSEFPSVGGELEPADARPEILRYFLAANESDLEPHANLLVETADKYELDWRLLPAIAQKESGLCRVIPPGGHNCWGWGIHKAGTLGFDSYEEGIETVAKGLKENYIDKGYITPEQIMTKYTPLSKGTWAEGVNYYMSLLE